MAFVIDESIMSESCERQLIDDKNSPLLCHQEVVLILQLTLRVCDSIGAAES